MPTVNEESSDKNMSRPSSGLWWLKNLKERKSDSLQLEKDVNITESLDLSLNEFLEKDLSGHSAVSGHLSETDIGGILEEINRLTRKSPCLSMDGKPDQLGAAGDRSIEDILREAERLSEANSKNIELLSNKSKSTLTTPRSIKSTPRTPILNHSISEEYENTFEDSKSSYIESMKQDSKSFYVQPIVNASKDKLNESEINEDEVAQVRIDALQEEIKHREQLLKEYEKTNRHLRREIKTVKMDYEEAKTKLAKDVALRTPDKSLQLELDQTQEKLKDLKEHNTALQLQLDSLNNSHQLLKSCNDELTKTNQALERRLIESESHFSKMKVELRNMQEKYQIIFDSEAHLKRAIDVEKTSNKSLKQQTEKDAKAIQDLTRQVKEMERIIARKHPDSVSALIVAANTNVDHNSNARQILEDRIKQLEAEAQNRETHSTKMFTDIQEKFNAMKQKYETHIQDLEDHVDELKTQLNCHVERTDVSIQTATVNQDRASGEFEINQPGIDIGVQTTNSNTSKLTTKNITAKKPMSASNTCGNACANKQQDSYLLATVRGLNNEVAQKERTVQKLQKEVEELKKTNRRLQKEREGSLKSSTINISERKDNNLFNKSYNPNEYKTSDETDAINMHLQVSALNDEKDKLQAQLNRLEDDYQTLKLKRLQDLNTLQVAHEEELTNYMGKMAPLREQLEIQQVSIGKLQSQLATAREQITLLTVERDHLDTRVKELRDAVEASRHTNEEFSSEQSNNTSEYATLRKKITQLERRYEDRELRLRAIVHGLVQKQSASRGDCEQCVIRQQQLCGYKAELDQILMTLKNHTNL